MNNRKKTSSKRSRHVPTKQQRQKQKEEILKWLLENYHLSENVAVPRDLVYQHFCHFCYKRDEDIGTRTFFTKIFTSLFPCLPTRRIGQKGDTRCFYDGLDINPLSDYFNIIAPHRVFHKISSNQTSSTQVCSFFHKSYLHKVRPLPETIKIVDSCCPDAINRNEEEEKTMNSESQPSTEAAPKIDPALMQERMEDLGQLLNPSSADDEHILNLLDLGHGTEEQISRMAEELMSHEAQDDLYDLIMQDQHFRPQPPDTGSSLENSVEPPEVVPSPPEAEVICDVRNDESNEMELGSEPPLVISGDTSIETAAPPDKSAPHKTDPVPDQSETRQRRRHFPSDCNSNSIIPKRRVKSTEACSSANETLSVECLRSQHWKTLTDMERKTHIEDVLHWLGSEYEVAPKMCVPRQTVYDHYLDFCNNSEKPAAGITLFGRILQKKFPRLTMRRLGGRGESRYFYMGIDILETSPQYATVIARRVYSAAAKPKSSIVNIHRNEIKGSSH